MSLNNGAANRQAHTQPVFLGGKKSLEDFFRLGETGAAVPNLNQHALVRLLSRANEESPRPVCNGFHGFHSIDEQIEQKLL